jgi:transcriptional regulator with XRE-family HTH domain
MALMLRREREAHGLSLRGLAQRSGVSVFRLADFEHSRRTPDADQYRRLQEALGLEDIPESSERLTDITLTTMAACLAWTHGIPLETLATALGLTESEVREGIHQVSAGLRNIGLDVSVDQTRAHVEPVSWCAGPVRSTASASPLTSAEVEILAVLYEHDGARVAEIEKVIGPTTRSTLASLSLRGLVSCAAQGQVAKRRYWVTDLGLMSAAAFALRRRQPRRPREPPTMSSLA